MSTIAFIGLGNMGSPMAENLLTAGYSLQVFDLDSSATQSVEQHGAKVFSSIEQVVQGADVVITMLPAGQHVRAVYLGKSGLLNLVSNNTFLIDSSTIDPESARVVAFEASAKGLDFVDAPVSGWGGWSESSDF